MAFIPGCLTVQKQPGNVAICRAANKNTKTPKQKRPSAITLLFLTAPVVLFRVADPGLKKARLITSANTVPTVHRLYCD